MQGPPYGPPGYPPPQGYLQQSYPAGYTPEPAPAPPPRQPMQRNREPSAWRLGRLVVGLIVGGTVLSALAVAIIFGDPVWFYNDGETPAELEVDGKRIRIAPHAWGQVRLRGNRSYDAKAKLDAGRTETWKVNLTHRPDFPTEHAYALVGTGCFALLDVTKLYRNEQPPLKVIGTFKKTHVLEQRVDRATVLDPGELPREVVFKRDVDTIVWITPASCEAIADRVAVQGFEATFKPPLEKKK